MIKLKKIEYHINQKLILQDINLNIEQGKTTIIMGKNGSGKSTLLKLLNQIIQPTSGLFQSLLDKPIPYVVSETIDFKKYCKL
jgi:ABC-type cobalamin/Fe3+-siderophores transport system ATPase subunit